MFKRVTSRPLDIINLRQLTSAASTANAAINHVKEWTNGSLDWQAIICRSNGNLYNVPEGLFCSFPCTTIQGEVHPITDIKFEDEFSIEKFEKTVHELVEERDMVADLL
jgi:malate dehydrogenase